MEQHKGAPGAGMAQAARTVLPGEPFDPPASSQVPAPRPAEEPQPVDGALWQYDIPAAAPAPGPDGFTVPPMGFETLQEFASLPQAEGFAPAPAAPAPAAFTPTAFTPAAFPQAEYQQTAYPPEGYQQEEAAMWPTAPSIPGQGYGAPYPSDAPAQFAAPAAPPAVMTPLLPSLPIEEEKPSRLRRSKAPKTEKAPKAPKAPRSGPAVDKKVLAVALVAVVAGGGYFGYTQLSKKSTPAATPAVTLPSVTPIVPKYNFPADLAGFTLQSSTAGTAGERNVRAFVQLEFPRYLRTLTYASYSPGTPAIYSWTLHPGATAVAATYAKLSRSVQIPSKGGVMTPLTSAVTGAAGGQMSCGGRSGADAASYCIWRGATTVGYFSITGSPKTQITQIMTRELRAYAEH